jgi:hypothetical protein
MHLSTRDYLIIYVDVNAQINQLLAPRKVGHDVDYAAKSRVMRLPVFKGISVANSLSVSPAEKFDC